MNNDKLAFFNVCRESKPASSFFVSLYQTVPYYGGPEEGGWWGSDVLLVAYQEFATREAAQAAHDAVYALAAQMSKDAKDNFNRACAAETEWLEARGLDDSFLREVDGEVTYWVTVEEQPGEFASEGSRHYE